MLPYTKTKTDAYKKHAEVFTPTGIVFEMILQDGIRELIMDVDKTICDPAVGYGQFPCAELVWKLFYNMEGLNEDIALRALKSLYGVDVQEESVKSARGNLIEALCRAYKNFTGKEFTRINEARAIVEENIIVGDFLKIAAEKTNPQLSLF